MSESHDRSPSTMQRIAFTLIELLVVVAVVGLLVSILLPSLRKAREQARTVACTAGLRGISSAGLIYAGADPGENLVPVHRLYALVPGDIGAYDWGGKSGIGEPSVGTDASSSIWGTQNGRGPGTRPLNDVLFKSGFPDTQNVPGPNQVNWLHDAQLDLAIYRCPSDRGYAGFHYDAWRNSGLTSYDHYGTSYAASLLWEADESHPGDPCTLLSFTPYLRPPSRVPNPANTIYFLENSGRFGWAINFGADADGDDLGSACSQLHNVPSSLGTGVDKEIRGWHGRPFLVSVSFVDGHAALVNMRGHQRPAPHLPYYPGSGVPGSTAGYVRYHCAIIRGSGWQIDTLPAPFVISEIPCEHANSVMFK